MGLIALLCAWLLFLINNDVVQYRVCLFVVYSESQPVEAKLPWLKQAQELEETKVALEDPTWVFFHVVLYIYSYANISLLPFSRIGQYSCVNIYQKKCWFDNIKLSKIVHIVIIFIHFLIWPKRFLKSMALCKYESMLDKPSKCYAFERRLLCSPRLHLFD